MSPRTRQLYPDSWNYCSTKPLDSKRPKNLTDLFLPNACLVQRVEVVLELTFKDQHGVVCQPTFTFAHALPYSLASTSERKRVVGFRAGSVNLVMKSKAVAKCVSASVYRSVIIGVCVCCHLLIPSDKHHCLAISILVWKHVYETRDEYRRDCVCSADRTVMTGDKSDRRWFGRKYWCRLKGSFKWMGRKRKKSVGNRRSSDSCVTSGLLSGHLLMSFLNLLAIFLRLRY